MSLESEDDGPITRRFDVPTPEQIEQQEDPGSSEQKQLLRKMLWTLLAMVLLALAILYVALFLGPNRTAAGLVDSEAAICYNLSSNSAEEGNPTCLNP